VGGASLGPCGRLDTSPIHHNIEKPVVRSRGRLEGLRIHADIRQNHTDPTPKIQTRVVVVHATVPNPERRLEYSSRGGEQRERGKGDVRGVVGLWLRRVVRASRLRAFYGIFYL
jgi:hypothetical protein